MIGGTFKIDTKGFGLVISEAKTRQMTLKGVKAGVRVLQEAARAAAPRRARSGALRQSQGVLAKKGRKGSTISFAVQGARKRVVRYVKLKGYRTPQKVVPAFYDHLVQGGTQAHSLARGSNIKKHGAPKLRDIASALKEGFGIHPGTKPNPYRKRAWAASKGRIGDTTRAAMAAEAQKIIARASVKGKR